MKIISATDTGLVRSSNQDSMASGQYADGSVWAVVCDGMGGANGGDYASSKAVEVIGGMLAEGYRGDMNGSEIRSLLELAVITANDEVYRQALGDLFLYGMGTTVVAAILRGGTVYIAHAGDSRAYRISGGSLIQLTTDHSMVQELVDSGRITPEQARNHPRKNIITRALGTQSTIELDFTESQIGPEDKLLLCTDGLSNYIEPDEIIRLAGSVPAEQLAGEYIKAACANGGGDNVTAVIICE